MSNGKLRIVHCFRAPVGGVFRHVRDLAAAQAAAGHSVGIVCDSSTGGDFEEKLFAAMGDCLALGVHRIAMQRHVGPSDIASAWRSFQIIRKLRPDVLHGHGAKGGVFARLFGSLLRVPRSRVARLYSPHGGSLHHDEASLAGKFYFTLERAMCRLTDTLLFVSEYERQTYIRKIGKPRVPNTLIYNGIQPGEFEPVPARPGAADLLYIGTMRDLKGPDIFIDAVAMAQTQLGRNVTAVMVGDGADLPRYKARVAQHGLTDRVRFLPSMPARDAFALAHLVVVPSRAEAMPYIVLETLAAGKPMIATAVGGIPEIFGINSPALVRPDPASLAEKIAAALPDLDAYSRMMPQPVEVKSHFGTDVMAAAIERAYFGALQRN
ncbi:glycosyltransferase family 4 protein [Manganibacter manganicus]|uniref:Glycosyl transferase n=1 Tax=Manganibacter manganicus TaxID=1873176 RepID=A0A1V8RWR9_9HYPH|nr:glycosyltransferase family 4 protein [Pseudaminobacter manganicus]OQM77595.1 glycosyl transferase [Pseudaminobacter manganicus]